MLKEHLSWKLISILDSWGLNLTFFIFYLSFDVASDNPLLGLSQKADDQGRPRESAGIEELQEQDELLNKELCSLRSQLIMVRRPRSTQIIYLADTQC